MAIYLADPQITTQTITSEAIKELCKVFERFGKDMPEYIDAKEGETSNVTLIYTIRFDRKGYQVATKEKLLEHFDSAAKVERVIFSIASGESIRTNNTIGSYMNLQLDINENVDHFLIASSDKESWMNGAIAAVSEVLDKHPNKLSIVRHPALTVFTNITGLIALFAISIKGAELVDANVTKDYAFPVSFLLLLLICSTFWVPTVIKLRALFPKIRFSRPGKDKVHWLVQGLILVIISIAMQQVVQHVMTPTAVALYDLALGTDEGHVEK